MIWGVVQHVAYLEATYLVDPIEGGEEPLHQPQHELLGVHVVVVVPSVAFRGPKGLTCEQLTED